MRLKYKYIVCLSVIAALLCSTSVFAVTCGGVETSLIECEDNESGIWHILNLILDILSMGVGILGVIGISVAGVQYLSAKGNEEQTRKAKNRILQVVIGLVAYVILFAGLEWLLSGGTTNSQSELASIGSTAQIREQEKQREEAKKKAEAETAAASSSSSTVSKKKTNEEIRQELNKMAKYYANASNRKQYEAAVKEVGVGETKGDGNDNCFKTGRACSAYVATVIRSVIPSTRGKNGWPARSANVLNSYIPKHSTEWKEVPASKAQAGDVAVKNGHIAMVVETDKGLRIAEAYYSLCKSSGEGWPRITGATPTSRKSLTYYRYVGGN